MWKKKTKHEHHCSYKQLIMVKNFTAGVFLKFCEIFPKAFLTVNLQVTACAYRLLTIIMT